MCTFLTSFCNRFLLAHTNPHFQDFTCHEELVLFPQLFCSGMLSRCRRTQQPPGTYRSLNCCSSFCFGFAAFHRPSFRKNLSIAKRAVQGWRSLARSLSVSLSPSVTLFLSFCLSLLVSLSLSVCLFLVFPCISPCLSLALSVCLSAPLSPRLHTLQRLYLWTL